MLTHILRDEAIRVLPWWLGIGAAITLHLYVISLHPDFQTAPWALVPWFPLALYLLLLRDGRAGELDLTLPIPARRLWLAHLLALGLGAAAVLTVSAVLMALRAQVVGEPGAVAEVTVTALRFAVGLGVVLALTQSYEPALVAHASAATPVSRHDLFRLAVLGGVPVIVLVLEVGWLLALLGAALMLTFRTWRSLPPALILELSEPPAPAAATVAEPRAAGPREAGPRPGEPRSPAVHRWRFARRRGPAVRLARLFLHLHAHGGRKPHQVFVWCFGWPAWLLLGLGLSRGAPPVGDIVGTLLLLMGLPSLLAALWIPLALTLRLMTMLDPLPLSRRFLFAASTLPATAALALGLGIGALRGAREGAYAATAATVLLLVSAAWLGSTAFATRSRRNRWGCSIYAVVLAMLLAYLPLRFAAVKGWLDALLVFTEAFAGQLAAALPGGEAALRILSAIVLGAAYVLAEARFRRFEVVPDPGQDDYWYFADLQPYLKTSGGNAS